MWMMKFVIVRADTEVCPYGWMRLFIHYSFFDTLLLLMVKQQPFLPLTYEYGQVSLAHVLLMVS